MHPQYPPIFFWVGLLLKFISRVSLFLPGLLLLIAGIWSKPALIAGLLLLAANFGLALYTQLKIKRAFETGAGTRTMPGFSGGHAAGDIIETNATERDADPDQNLLNG